MCDACTEILDLIATSGDPEVCWGPKKQLSKSEISTVCTYVLGWSQRQCMCIYKDSRNYDRFNHLIQGVLWTALELIRSMETGTPPALAMFVHVPESEERKACGEKTRAEERQQPADAAKDVKGPLEKAEADESDSGKQIKVKIDEPQGKQVEEPSSTVAAAIKQIVGWSLEEKEHLLQFVTKVFQVNFPHYAAYKHSVHSKLEEISQQEATILSVHCDINDPDIPIHLLRNVCFFCDHDVLMAMAACFVNAAPETLPFCLARTMISIVSNLKLWLNVAAVVKFLVPLRSSVIRYMCKLSDKDLRSAGTRSMSEFMWTAVKDPLDSHLSFDKEGLDLAYKYFTSSTLTMRLAGIAHINNHVTIYNELTNSETVVETEIIGLGLADWLIKNRIIENIFGPNLHVEIIKQSHIALNFLAMEGCITNEHVDCMWSAAQLKHCSKQVHDLLLPLIKHLEQTPVMHLYQLLCRLEPQDHTEQTLYLASALLKVIWSNGNVQHNHLVLGCDQAHLHRHPSPFTSVLKGTITELSHIGSKGSRHDASSSEHSISLDSDEEAAGPNSAELAAQIASHAVKLSQEAGPSEPGSSNMLPADVARLREWADEQNSFTSSDNESDVGEMDPPRGSGHVGKGPLNIGSRVSVSLPSSDSEGRIGEGEDSVSENEVNEPVRRRRSRALLDRQHQRRLLLRRRHDHLLTPIDPEPNTGACVEITTPVTVEPNASRQAEDDIGGSAERPTSIKDTLKKAEGESNAGLEMGATPAKKRKESSPLCAGKEGKDPPLTEDENLEPKVYECMQYFEPPMQSQRLQHPEGDLTEDIMSPDDGSCSSRMSTKSEKNMADFEGEESGCEDELLQLTSAQAYLASPHHVQHHLAKMASMYCAHMHRAGKVAVHPGSQQDDSSYTSSCLDIESVCRPGQTLLWDLLQDEFVVKLGKGLALEAEKVLSNLVCWSTDRIIRMKFIEGCLQNLANHKSIYLSLRLLPRLFGSFQQYRGRMDTHTITMWAEKEHHMMELFFNNLLVYTNLIKSAQNPAFTLYSHQVEIQVRLQFLTCIFSAGGSPECFRLSLDQVDALWSCLANDPDTADELFSWLLTQAKNKEQHALGMDALKHIFTEKLPLLQPETTSMTALNLIQQLSNITRHSEESEQTGEGGLHGMDQLWGIALRAQSTDVSMAAIQYLNSYYINGHPRTLEREEEFIQRCMTSLASVLPNFEQCEELSLVVVQRALLLLKTHLETFQRRYAYHLRMWHLQGRGICSHQRPLVDRQIPPIRVVCQPAGITEKAILELLTTDYVADFRAEVTHWWEQFQQQHRNQNRHQDADTSQDGSSSSSSISGDSSSAQQDTPQSASSPPSILSPILGAMLTDGPIRVITQGQELTTDLDERTIGELGFKDMQLVFVSVGAPRPARKRDELEPASVLPPPPREKLPAMLLLQPKYLEQFFRLIQQLGQLKAAGREGILIHHTKGHLLSWKVWEILMMLPTCPTVLTSLRGLESDASPPKEDFRTLLDPQTPHKLMYSLQIIESLARSERPCVGFGSSVDRESNMQVGKGRHPPDAPSLNSDQGSTWAKQFVEKGGLQHLFDIFMSGTLQVQDQGIWSEWHQDCMAYLLKLIYQLGLETLENDGVRPVNISDSLAALTSMTSASGAPAASSSTTRRKSKKQKKGNSERLTLPKLNKIMLTMMSDVTLVTQRIVSILYDAGRLRDSAHYKIGVGGRGQVVHFGMSFLLSWALSCEPVKTVLFNDSYMTGWLHHLLLDDPEPSVRQEVCSNLYRLCLGMTLDGQTGHGFVVPLLKCLIGFLHSAKNMKPSRIEFYPEGDKDKEPYGPACREYFWLVCRLFDSLDDDTFKDNFENDTKRHLDLDNMAHQLVSSVLTREFLETRHSSVEDDGLIGLLNLCSAVIKHNPSFKFSKEGQEFLVRIFDCLFALPSPKQRYLPLCKSQPSRSAAYDLLVELTKGCFENYCILHAKLMQQHSPNSHSPYPWDYWPHEDGRSDCGYVGLTNLGATCYMASCMQHLYMMPQARASILTAKARIDKCSLDSKHETTLVELQRMFAYLLESERKAYNPRSFCKVYTMDHQPLNTGEQKDMAEFFTDLISKLEEMTPQLKELVKTLFCGVITNNVVSLDCPHVSRTIEEFYTVRCQVADMRNLYESLDEVTVKDTLEGDNMYTCSQCGRKVRAEKRACFKNLPRILCFNTMRYTFNMVTMMKEKVNTHFSFPLRLDMSKYTERHLMPDQYNEFRDDADAEEKDEYDLIGITVHTGTADGGHYYSFIRDRTSSNKDKWFLFNDAEVKPFDPAQIAAECFGGEMTSKTYDSVTDKFMDFSFEKTNSAYMLFYERAAPGSYQAPAVTAVTSLAANSSNCSAPVTADPPTPTHTIELPKDLADWIWEDNMQFLQDKNIFEHSYFNFMWQVCGYVPQTLTQHKDVTHVTLLAAKLSTSFVLETLIHAKEKPTMVQWIELLTKLFNSSQIACEWFLEHMAEHDWWPVQILIRCPNQVVRQMFQRLCMHVINKLRALCVLKPAPLGNAGDSDSSDAEPVPGSCLPCVARFIKKLLLLIEHGANQHTKHLTEYFGFLLDFAKTSSRECQFLLSVETISTIVNFYLGHKAGDYVDPVSDEEEEEVDDVLSLNEDKYKPASLERMVALIATLVEKSRGDNHHLQLSANDFSAVAGGKGFPFLFQQIRDNINIRQTCNLIFSLSRWNEPLAIHMVAMIFQSISQHPEQSQPFFKLLSMLVEFVGGPPGMPAFTKLVLQHIWEVAEACPQQCLEWLSLQVPRNKMAHSWVLQHMESWVEHFLVAHSNQRVRNAAAFLLVSLIPSSHFKQAFRNARNMLSPQKDIPMSSDAVMVLHHIYDLLLRLLKHAKHYVDTAIHGTTKLTSYFALMTYCLVSHTEKLMFGQYFQDLWQLFQPKLSEPPIAVHHNKQALLIFWYQVCIDCPENVKLIVQNAHVTKNIAFNYILADHEDQDVMIFNRYMLPAYYGLLRLCCQQSRPFTRQLANHQNIQWAFKNITPYPAQYPAAVEELYKLMRLFVAKYPDMTEQEMKEITGFKCTTLQLYLSILDGRACWATLVSVLRILIDSNDDRLFLICNNGLPMLFEAFQTLHVMYHEATACHVTADLVELLVIILDVLKCGRGFRDGKGIKQYICAWKERSDPIRKLLTLLNSYAPSNLRQVCIDVLRELVMFYPIDCLQTMVPIMTHSHSACQENAVPMPPGPYFPRRGQKHLESKSASRPPNPFLQMTLHPSQLEVPKGVDPEYDQLVMDYFFPYHLLLDIMCRVAVNHDLMSEALVNLSAAVGTEGIPLHLAHFPKLWIDVHQAEHVDRKYMEMLCGSYFLIDYVDRVLSLERCTLANPFIFQFMYLYMPRISGHFSGDRTRNLVGCLLSTLEAATQPSTDLEADACRLNGDLLALKLLCLVECTHLQRNVLQAYLEKIVQQSQQIRKVADEQQQKRQAASSTTTPMEQEATKVGQQGLDSARQPSASDEACVASESPDGSSPSKRPKMTEGANGNSTPSSSAAAAAQDAVAKETASTTDGSRPASNEVETTFPQMPARPDWIDMLAKTAASLADIIVPPPVSSSSS